MFDWIFLWENFFFGLIAPLGAICVLPLYPGFLAFLSKNLTGKHSRKHVAYLGFLIMAGILTFMAVLGFIFSFLLQKSLTPIIGIVSPIAFVIVGIIGVLLVCNINIGNFIPQIRSPTSKNPRLSAYLFGLFFGAVVIPCNPGPITWLFANSVGINAAVLNFGGFILFGFGMSLPLIILSLLSTQVSRSFTSWLAKHERAIYFVTGILMIVFSIWNLIGDFA